jgi:hypothetical protein
MSCLAGYLLAVWHRGMRAWKQDLANQGPGQPEPRREGPEPKAIDLSRSLRKVADHVSPFRSAFQVERVLDEVLEEPEDEGRKATLPIGTGSGAIGPTQAVDLGPTLEEPMAELRRVLANQ